MEDQQIKLQEQKITAAPQQDLLEQKITAPLIQNMQEQNVTIAPLQEVNEQQDVEAGTRLLENPPAQMPPLAAPQLPMPQETAAMSKQEKKLLKRRQQEELQRQQQEERVRQEEIKRQAEEAVRRQREEAARIRREEREARLRKEEEERQEKRKILFEDDVTLHAMEAMAQEKDAALLQEKMQQFLRTAAEKLLEKQPELKEEYCRTVDYVPIAESMKLIAAEHAVNAEQMKLVEKADQQMEALEALNQENIVLRVIEFELGNIFREEYQALGDLKKAAVAMMIQYQKKEEKQTADLEELAKEAARVFHIKGKDGEETSVLGKGSPFAYFGKKKALKEYHAQVQRVMEEKHCTRKEAEGEVVKERRKVLQEKALKRTAQGSVVKEVSEEVWKTNGGASFHYTLPAGEALQMVEESHGYLYAEDVGAGLMELHHTIPETIELEIKGEKKEYPLRRNYNLLIKCIVTQMIDENGNMYQDEAHKKQMSELQYQLFRAASKESMDFEFVNAIKDSVRLLFESEEEADAEAEQMCEFLRNMTAASKTGNFILSTEIFVNLGRFIQFYEAAGDTSYDIRIDRLRKEWAADPEQTETPEEIEKILKQIPNVSLTEQRERLIEVMKEEGYEQEKIDKYVEALVSFHADMDAVAMDLLDIRNMDIQSIDVPLPNACSANACFYDNLSQLRSRELGIMLYETRSHVEEFPRQELARILKNPQMFSKFKGNEARLREIAARCLDEKYELTKEELDVILVTAYEAYKYSYHQAAQIGESSDGTVTTCETFAAETTQAMVAPFVRRAAIGRYKGSVREEKTALEKERGSKVKLCEGMIHYYNQDDPLPQEEDLRAELKEVFLHQMLPGAAGYVKKSP